MGRYCDWGDVVGRYPEVGTVGDAVKIGSSYIVYAEGYVDASLRSHYTTPFSGTILLVKDLAIDMAYYMAAGRKLKEANAIWGNFHSKVRKIKRGELSLVYEDGTVLEQSVQPAVYTTAGSYHSAFGMDDPIEWSIDPDQAEADAESRS